ncbi:hypothetical protein chiPu_0016770 [Chiloscyllium punctatum]|uniref:Uncharacterized protein n=1 Tax=Chiloscyllium punctatum TaxID=137246 RepID=A0A401T6L9_CHIPU|nr:hypothetical protein [Chiloscyllium punctatum]
MGCCSEAEEMRRVRLARSNSTVGKETGKRRTAISTSSSDSVTSRGRDPRLSPSGARSRERPRARAPVPTPHRERERPKRREVSFPGREKFV